MKQAKLTRLFVSSSAFAIIFLISGMLFAAPAHRKGPDWASHNQAHNDFSLEDASSLPEGNYSLVIDSEVSNPDSAPPASPSAADVDSWGYIEYDHDTNNVTVAVSPAEGTTVTRQLIVQTLPPSGEPALPDIGSTITFQMMHHWRVLVDLRLENGKIIVEFDSGAPLEFDCNSTTLCGQSRLPSGDEFRFAT